MKNVEAHWAVQHTGPLQHWRAPPDACGEFDGLAPGLRLALAYPCVGIGAGVLLMLMLGTGAGV